MDISVIVPVYNVEAYLEDCLNSLIMQEFNGTYEIICINDGSPDDSDIILKKYAEKHPVIKIINQENKGISGTRNTGVRNAKGKYMMFIDSDDYLHNTNSLDVLYNEAEENDLEIVMANLEYAFEDKTKNYSLKRNKSMINKVMSGEDWLHLDGKNLYPVNKLYRRDFIIDNNLFFTERILYEDVDFTPRVYCLAKRVKYIDLVTYSYRQREGSTTHIQNKVKLMDDFFVIVDNLNEFNKNYQSKSLLHVELDVFSRYIIGHLNSVEDKQKRKSYKLKLKERQIPYKFFHSDRIYYKAYGLLCLLGMSGIFRVKYDIIRILKNNLSTKQLERLRIFMERLLN